MAKKGYQRLPDGCYRAQPRDPTTGRRVNVTAATLGELEAKMRRIAQVRDDLRFGAIDPREAASKMRPVTGERLTLAAVWEEFFPGVPPRSQAVARSTWERRVKPYLGELHVWELDEAKMRAWASRLEGDGFAPKTIRCAYDFLVGAVHLAIDRGLVESLPWRAWRPRKAVRLVEPECCGTVAELVRLIEAARIFDERDWSEGRFADRAVRIAVVALCGLRQGEACGLSWNHIDEERRTMHVEYQAARGWPARWPEGRPLDPPKTKPRRILLHASALAAIDVQREQLRARGWWRADGPVFPVIGGGWRTTARVMKPEHLREIVTLADLPNVAAWRTHSLRHTFASLETIGSGGDLMATQKRTGHTSLKQLAGYLHSSGRGGMPESSIPEVALGPLFCPDPVADPAQRAELEGAIAQFGARRIGLLSERQGRGAALRREAERPFEELAREWLARGERPKPRPPAVTLATRSAYVRAYKAALVRPAPRWELLSPGQRALLTDELRAELRRDYDKARELAAGAGRRARRAALGAWGQAIKRAKASRVSSAPPAPTA